MIAPRSSTAPFDATHQARRRAIGALTQEINTLIHHLDPRRARRRGPAHSGLETRLQTLRAARDQLTRTLHPIPSLNP